MKGYFDTSSLATSATNAEVGFSTCAYTCVTISLTISFLTSGLRVLSFIADIMLGFHFRGILNSLLDESVEISESVGVDERELCGVPNEVGGVRQTEDEDSVTLLNLGFSFDCRMLRVGSCDAYQTHELSSTLPRICLSLQLRLHGY